MTAITIKAINRALRNAGAQEQLCRGDGYYYFVDGDAHLWHTTMVCGIYYLNRWTIDQWVDCWRDMRDDYLNSIGDVL